ncbi:MFS transporter [Arthrobacter sp. GMC3]|uniref:MFS transporter n=1 Tax=Arthrobacter sp. GMC3 TaxID=2058894 RepID=UPI0011B06E2D|nr:MFS transporter [Arthrobacter sp. GMC3]
MASFRASTCPMFGSIAKHFNVSDADITWFNTLQTLAAGVCVPILAKLGDIFGHRRVLRISIITVLIGGLLVALAPSFEWALLGRVLTGPLAVWLPLEIALVHNKITGDTARKSIGLLVSALTIGAVFGTLASGLIASLVSSMTILLLVPVAITVLCVIIVYTKVPESDIRTNPKIDYIGFVGLAIFMMALLWGLRSAQGTGFGSAAAIVPLVIAAVVLVAWVLYELRVDVPAIHVRLVTSRALWPAYATSFLFGMVLFGTQTITTTFLAGNPDLVGYGFAFKPGTIALFSAGSALLAAVGASTFAYLAKPLGMRGVLVTATLLGVAANLVLIFGHDSVGLVVLSTVLSGLSGGFLLGALPALVAEVSPSDQTGIATGVYNSLKTLGGSAAGAIFGVILASFAISGTKSSSLGGYQTIWAMCAAAFIVCVFTLIFMPKPRHDLSELVAEDVSVP